MKLFQSVLKIRFKTMKICGIFRKNKTMKICGIFRGIFRRTIKCLRVKYMKLFQSVLKIRFKTMKICGTFRGIFRENKTVNIGGNFGGIFLRTIKCLRAKCEIVSKCFERSFQNHENLRNIPLNIPQK